MREFFSTILFQLISLISGVIIAVGVVDAPSGLNYDAERQNIIRNREVRNMIDNSDIILKQKPLVSDNEGDVSKNYGGITQSNNTEKEIIIAKKETSQVSPAISLDELNEKTRNAVVNIICTSQGGGVFQPSSGSGVLIDSRGIILTNAHVAKYFLVKDYLTENFIECKIRTGSPAKYKYKADLIYINPNWVKEHAEDIIKEKPTGTGENDFALLIITGPIAESGDFPQNFSHVEPDFDFNYTEKEDSMLLVSYPAGFLGGISIQKDLWQVSAEAAVKELYTFANVSAELRTLDLISLGGSAVAQSGSSGGAVMNQMTGKLDGILVTSTDAETTDARDLKAITLSHIARSFQSQTGQSIGAFLSNNSIDELKTAFTKDFEPLKDLLIRWLNSR